MRLLQITFVYECAASPPDAIESIMSLAGPSIVLVHSYHRARLSCFEFSVNTRRLVEQEVKNTNESGSFIPVPGFPC